MSVACSRPSAAAASSSELNRLTGTTRLGSVRKPRSWLRAAHLPSGYVRINRQIGLTASPSLPATKAARSRANGSLFRQRLERPAAIGAIRCSLADVNQRSVIHAGEAAVADRSRESSRIVTGPSLIRLTCMSAANTPCCGRRPVRFSSRFRNSS